MSKTGISIVLAGLLLSSQVSLQEGVIMMMTMTITATACAAKAAYRVVHHVYEEPRVVYRDRVVYQGSPGR